MMRVSPLHRFLEYRRDPEGQLLHTKLDYHASADKVPDGYRMTTLAEEISRYWKNGGRLGNTRTLFNVLQGNNGYDPNIVTSTGLRAPRDWEHRYEKDGSGNRRTPRVLLIDYEEIGDVFVPESGLIPCTDNLDDVIDPQTGLPRFTVQHNANHIGHFVMPECAVPDTVTGERDLAVILYSERANDRYDQCLKIEMLTRHTSCTANHVRIVSSPMPKIKLENTRAVSVRTSQEEYML